MTNVRFDLILALIVFILNLAGKGSNFASFDSILLISDVSYFKGIIFGFGDEIKED